MNKYYTKQFIPSTVLEISDWLNSFEEKRNGRPNCEYFLEIISYDVFQDTIVVTVSLWEKNKNNETISKTNTSS